MLLLFQTWRDEHSVPFSWYNQSCEPIVAVPPPFVCLTSPDESNVQKDVAAECAGSGGGRISRRSSRASTPERRRSPLMRPKHAPPPPPPSKDSVSERKKEKEPATVNDTLSLGLVNRQNSLSQESISSAHGQSMRPPSSAPQHNHKKRQAPRPPVRHATD